MCAMASSAVVAQRWANGMSGASDKIKAGVMGVTESPTAKAAQSLDRMLAGIQRAIQSGKMAAALNAVTLPAWQAAMIDKGVLRVASGATAAKPKFEAFMRDFLPYLEQGRQQLASMPRGDLETNINRATTMMRWNANYRRNR